MLTLAAGIGWNLFQDRLMRAALVPSAPFAPPGDAGAPDYGTAAAWLARPDLADDPTHWTPKGVTRAAHPDVAVFYVPPTTYLRRTAWNAPLDDAEANGRLRIFAASQASAFNSVGAIWAPRYRQATMGAFLTSTADAGKALDFAYRDVERAFGAFLAQVPPHVPIILAGHSQGSLHLLRLLAEHVAGQPVQRRIVAAYAVGWPVSVEADVPALGLQPCARAGQTGCILSWQSFAEPADPSQVRDVFDLSTGFTGRPRKGTHMLCVNPLTGRPGDTAPASANLGALQPTASLTDAILKPGAVPARCDASGVLLIGPPPEGYGAFVLRGENYHVFDYALFWANIRADAEARVAAFHAQHG
ncbi:DUF3089 domain-containing protein [Sphingomonas quercus]